jgi:hypothetical protein
LTNHPHPTKLKQVACKPASCFEHRSSCYVAALGFSGSPEAVDRLTATLASLAAAGVDDDDESGAKDATRSTLADRHSNFPCAPFVDTTPGALFARHGDAIKASVHYLNCPPRPVVLWRGCAAAPR